MLFLNIKITNDSKSMGFKRMLHLYVVIFTYNITIYVESFLFMLFSFNVRMKSLIVKFISKNIICD